VTPQLALAHNTPTMCAATAARIGAPDLAWYSSTTVHPSSRWKKAASVLGLRLQAML
jgi:hypothetical protein